MNRIIGSTVAIAIALALQASAQAGMIDRIREGKPLVIANRESSIPFSYQDSTGQAIGYSVELCRTLSEALRKAAGVKTIQLNFLTVTSATRMQAIKEGKADLECGSTSNTAERRKEVGFLIPHFITGARLLVKADSPVEVIEELEHKRVVSTRGTTPLKALNRANSERLLRLTIVEAPDHLKAVEMVERGEADAFAMDDVLLFGLAASRPNPHGLKVVGKFLTTEAIAVMLAKDDVEAKKVLDGEIRRLIYSGELSAMYEKWFMKPIPNTAAPLNMPMSYLLRSFWKFPTDFVPE
jgi:glutamate/aspartate transport system substrate-binding protein